MNRDNNERRFRDHDRRDNRDRNNRDRNFRDRDSRDHDELYSQQVSAGKRKYFFDVKATKSGDKFVTISESRKIFDNDSGVFYFDRNRVFIYKEDFEKFRAAFDNAMHFIDTGEMREAPSDDDHYGEDNRDDDCDRSEAMDGQGGSDSTEAPQDSINDIHISEI